MRPRYVDVGAGFLDPVRVEHADGGGEGPYQITTPSGELVHIMPINEQGAAKLAQTSSPGGRSKPIPPPTPPAERKTARQRLVEMLHDAASPQAWQEICEVRARLDELEDKDIWSDSQKRYIEAYVDGAMAEILHRVAEMVVAVLAEEGGSKLGHASSTTDPATSSTAQDDAGATVAPVVSNAQSTPVRKARAV